MRLMKVFRKVTDFEKIKKGSVLTIGNFDGVHLGHQEILMVGREIAAKRETEFVVMTFEPHPVAILHPDKAPSVLTPLLLKMHLLRQYADCLIVLKGTKELLELSPDDFVDKFLMEGIRPSVIVEGNDFNFGANRKGDIDTLKNLAVQKDFEVAAVAPKHVRLATGQNIKVSSTIIRYMLESGHVSEAATALSRPYRLMGKIVPGKGRGKKLGFPTLNLSDDSQDMRKPCQIIPQEGVYAGFVEMAESEENLLQKQDKMPAVFSIGQARTFGEEHSLLIEAHLLVKQPGDVADKWIAMDFVQRLRSQHKFRSPDALVKQIAKDCEQARGVLKLVWRQSRADGSQPDISD
jgi:riboflavin kinase/FMN adenylyltransferase